MATKRPRLALDVQPPSTTTSARVSLPHLPIEILAEILLCTHSPQTVLAVARTCSFLYRSLAHNPDASYIWRAARRACKPRALPDPGEAWQGNEAEYVAFVFSGGTCEVCSRRTREMYASFSARVRLCGNWHCRSKFLEEHVVDVTAELLPSQRLYLWVPPLESIRCLYPNRVEAPTWPNGQIMLRKRDWEANQIDLQAYSDAGRAHLEGKDNEETQRAAERGRAVLKRLPRIMKVSERLVRWKWDYDRAYRGVKRHNSQWTKSLAESEGWDLDDLLETQSFGSLQRCKNLHLETIESQDVIRVRSTIESELLSIKSRHQRQQAESTYRKNLTEIGKLYERMRCGTLDAGGTELPPRAVFFTLPSVRVLKGSPDSSAGNSPVEADVNSPLVIALVKKDVHSWLVPVKKRLMTLLGYPNGWQSASTRAINPLRRVTARFFCRRCGEGKVGRAYQRERCLDFKGVCSHVCRTKSRNKTLEWTVEVFEKDTKAITVIQTMLSLTDNSEESYTVGAVDEVGYIRCRSCQGRVVMDFETAIGHAHRHETMRIELEPRVDGVLPAVPEFARGKAQQLLGPSLGGKNLCKKVEYGCRHCIDEECKELPKAMSFNGLRSHVKEKHGIEEIGDEDLFTRTGSVHDG